MLRAGFLSLLRVCIPHGQREPAELVNHDRDRKRGMFSLISDLSQGTGIQPCGLHSHTAFRGPGSLPADTLLPPPPRLCAHRVMECWNAAARAPQNVSSSSLCFQVRKMRPRKDRKGVAGWKTLRWGDILQFSQPVELLELLLAISVHRKETNSWMWRTDLCLPRGRRRAWGGLGVWG